MNAWERWKVENKKNLEHPAGYEEKFVDLVLSKIDNISPKDVISQYHFLDQNNKNRYIDFVIKNSEKGYFLPIELDGLAKFLENGEANYYRFQDFLKRQNALIKKFGVVLRYSNKDMFNDTSYIVREITETLKLQSLGKIEKKSVEEEYKSIIQKYKKEIDIIEKRESQKISLLEEKLNKAMKQAETSTENEAALAGEISIYKEKIKELQITASMLDLAKMIESLDKKINNINQTSSKKIQTDSDVQKKQNTTKKNFLTISYLIVIALSLLVPVKFLFFYSSTSSENLVRENSNSTLENVSSETKSENFLKKSITSKEAYLYIGKNIEFCGKIVELSKFKEGIYINFDNKFPNQSITAVVWKNDKKTIDIISELYKKEVCINGEIENYKNKPQVILRSSSQISY